MQYLTKNFMTVLQEACAQLLIAALKSVLHFQQGYSKIDDMALKLYAGYHWP